MAEHQFRLMFSGNHFENKGMFGQFPLQVEGFKDIHESLEAATAQGEIETLTDDTTIKSGQEVRTTIGRQMRLG